MISSLTPAVLNKRCLATLLDPRFKDCGFYGGSNYKAAVVSSLHSEFVAAWQPALDDELEMEAVEEEKHDQPAVLKNKKVSVEDFLADSDSDEDGGGEAVARPAKVSKNDSRHYSDAASSVNANLVMNEVDLYLLDLGSDPFEECQGDERPSSVVEGA